MKCATEPLDKLLHHAMGFGVQKKAKQTLRFWKDCDQPLVLLDADRNICPVTLDEQGNVIAAPVPGWLGGMAVYNNGRAVKYGDPRMDRGLERHSLRTKYRNQWQTEKRLKYNSRTNNQRRQEDIAHEIDEDDRYEESYQGSNHENRGYDNREYDNRRGNDKPYRRGGYGRGNGRGHY